MDHVQLVLETAKVSGVRKMLMRCNVLPIKLSEPSYSIWRSRLFVSTNVHYLQPRTTEECLQETFPFMTSQVFERI